MEELKTLTLLLDHFQLAELNKGVQEPEAPGFVIPSLLISRQELQLL